MSFKKGLAGVTAALMLTAPMAAMAQYPERPIKMVIGYTPGGAADKLARPISERVAQNMGQQFVFDYKPGAGATIALDYVSKQDPDGYTVHLTDSGPMTIVPHIRQLGYESLKDFVPLGMVGEGGVVVVVRDDSPAKTLQEFVELAKKDPAKWSYGTSGVGGVGHLAGEQFKNAANLDIDHIPYKGGNPAMTELLGGHVPVLFSSLGAAAPHIKAGTVRALANSASSRSSMFPDVPTIAEQGYPGFDAQIWFGMVAPAGLPADVESRLVSEFAKVMKDPEVQQIVIREGYEPMDMSQQQAADRIKADYAAWGETIKRANIK